MEDLGFGSEEGTTTGKEETLRRSEVKEVYRCIDFRERDLGIYLKFILDSLTNFYVILLLSRRVEFINRVL